MACKGKLDLDSKKMRENFNTLNTSLFSKASWGRPSLFYIDERASNNIFYCKNVKDITMDNQQVILCKNMFTFYVLIIIRFFKYVLWYLRDFTRRGIVLLRCLRYSPVFCKHIKLGYKQPRSCSLINIKVCKILKREFSTAIKSKILIE